MIDDVFFWKNNMKIDPSQLQCHSHWHKWIKTQFLCFQGKPETSKVCSDLCLSRRCGRKGPELKTLGRRSGPQLLGHGWPWFVLMKIMPESVWLCHPTEHDRTWSNPFHQRKHANETCTSMHRLLNWCYTGFILWELTMAMEAIQHLQDPFTLVPSLARQKALPDHSRPRRVPLDQIRHGVVSLLAPSNIWGTSFYQPPFFFQHHLCFQGGSRKCNCCVWFARQGRREQVAKGDNSEC